MGSRDSTLTAWKDGHFKGLMTKPKKRKAREYYIAANNLNDEVMGCSARKQTLAIKPWYFMDYTIIKVREVLRKGK